MYKGGGALASFIFTKIRPDWPRGWASHVPAKFLFLICFLIGFFILLFFAFFVVGKFNFRKKMLANSCWFCSDFWHVLTRFLKKNIKAQKTVFTLTFLHWLWVLLHFSGINKLTLKTFWDRNFLVGYHRIPRFTLPKRTVFISRDYVAVFFWNLKKSKIKTFRNPIAFFTSINLI